MYIQDIRPTTLRIPKITKPRIENDPAIDFEDGVFVENRTTVGIYIILSYKPFRSNFAAKLCGGLNAENISSLRLETGFEKRYIRSFQESKPMEIFLRPNEKTSEIYLEEGTKKLYYTILAPNGSKTNIPCKNTGWRIKPKNRFGLNGRTLLTVKEDDINGGQEIDFKIVPP